jgi:flagellar motor switch protein FliM
MEKSMFTKSEIELLLKSARAGKRGADVSDPPPSAEPFDFLGATHLSSAQTAQVSELHIDFAARLGQSLSNLIGSECKVTPESVGQLPYPELAKQFPESVTFRTLSIHTPEANVYLQADLASVLPMVDLMLGGDGNAIDPIRPLTEIDREMFKPVIDMLCAELHIAWATFLESKPCFEYCDATASLLPATERVLFIKFEIQIGELRGMWTLILPMLVSNALVRKLEQQLSPTESGRSEKNQLRLREKLLESHFKLELFLPPSGLSVRQLAHLKVGQVLVLKPRSTDPIHFNLEGINLFHALPVSCGAHRGAQIKRTLSIVKSEEKEAR